jgi:SAM-dependent methyltransferase
MEYQFEGADTLHTPGTLSPFPVLGYIFTNQHRDSELLMTNIDFGRHSDDYANYRPGPPASFYQRLDAIAAIRGSRSLDIATGPGTIAFELADRGSSVMGIDTSEQQIATAKRVAKERDLGDRAQFAIASAENTGLVSGLFDVATAGQCWHWFDSDVAIAETLRVLRPGGVLAIVYHTYLAEYSPVARDTEELVLKFNPSWNMAGWTGIFSERIDEVIRGGFRLEEQFCYHHDEEFSHTRWRGRMRTCSGVGSGNLSPTEVVQFDNALMDLLRSKYPDPMMVEYRVWSVVVRKPA